MNMEFKNIKSPNEFIGLKPLNESRRPIEAHKVPKENKDIKIFQNVTDFNVPISDESHVSAKPGTTFVCFENDVYVQNEKEETFSKALFETEFILMNKKIFEKI